MGRKNSKSGFSLIEILIVVAILAILIFLSITTLDPRLQLAKARDGQREADLKSLSLGFEDYIADNPCYPEESTLSTCGGEELKPYLRKVPCDPESRLPYLYERPECGKFILYTNLKTKNLAFNYNNKGNYVVTSSNLRLEPVEVGGSATPTLTVPTSEPGGDYYGCFSGVCKLLTGPVCQPSYLGKSDCWGECGSHQNPRNECL